MSISNTDDVIDSRDVTARITELENERFDWQDRPTDGSGTWEEEHPDDAAELKALKALADEGERATSEWSRGAGLIRDSYFEEHARQLAEDIGAIDSDARWPATCIDWERAARELRMDYTSVDFDGETYYVRS